MRNRFSCTWMWPSLVIALSTAALTFPLWCCADEDSGSARHTGTEAAAAWLENTELRAVRSTPGGNGAPAEEDPAPIAEVFDSTDYQTMLVLQRAWPRAYTLDLVTGEVLAHPTEEIVSETGQLRPADSGTSTGSFVSDPEGRIHFSTLEHEFVVEPLPPMVGEIGREELDRRQPVYARRAAAYDPDPAMIRALAEVDTDVEIVAFFGTWCLVCKHTLPALLGTLDAADNPHLNLRLVATDENMIEPADWIEICALDYTPTFMVFQDDLELGRIEEEPIVSMEADLIEIIERAEQR